MSFQDTSTAASATGRGRNFCSSGTRTDSSSDHRRFRRSVQKAQQHLHRADRASSVVHRHWLLNFCFVARQIASCVLPPPRPYVLMVTADTAGLQRGPGPFQSQEYLIPVANEANCQQPCSLPVRKLVSRAPRLRRRVSGDAWIARCRRCCGFPSYPSCGAAI